MKNRLTKYPSWEWSKPFNFVPRNDLRAYLERYSRTPFLDVLGHLLQCRPSPEAIYEWACNHPDRWANAISIFARLAGYQDQQEININITDPSQMSDAALLQRLLELRNRLQAQEPMPQMVEIEHKKEPSPEGEGSI